LIFIKELLSLLRETIILIQRYNKQINA